MPDVLFHLLFGFFFFLNRNLERMNFNADTFVPGLGAYLIFVGILHLMMPRLCRVRQRTWSFRSSCVVALLLPALFGISFLIPGVILLLQEIAKGS
ncbi:MAG: hypothetical protein V4689_09110 [Verrucomicrobiota bacterium]